MAVDLGKIMMTAQAIKNERRQSTLDTLREQALRQNIDQGAAAEGRAQGEYQAGIDARTARTRYLEAQAIEQADDPHAAAREFAPDIITEFEKAHGPGTFDQTPPDIIKKLAGMGKQKAAAIAGISLQGTPEQQFVASENAKQAEQGHKFRLEEIGATGAESRKTALLKPGRAFRAMSPEEIKAAGLPAGSSAQIDDSTGKIDVLSKRDTTASLSQKDATTAKMKLNTVSLARQQLNRIREEFEGKVDPKTGQRVGGIKGTMSAGAFGQGKIPTEGGRKFDAAVNQMRSTLTALTRVPGVGAMSDYETKLDQSKFPTRNDYESVTEQQLGDLDNMLNAIETGYTDLLSGGNAPGAQAATAQQPAQDPLGIR